MVVLLVVSIFSQPPLPAIVEGRQASVFVVPGGRRGLTAQKRPFQAELRPHSLPHLSRFGFAAPQTGKHQVGCGLRRSVLSCLWPSRWAGCLAAPRWRAYSWI